MCALMVLGRLHSWITFHLSSLLDRVSAACPFNRAGHLRSQQLIGLRKATYQSLRCAFRASRIATCIMLKSYPPESITLSLACPNISLFVHVFPWNKYKSLMFNVTLCICVTFSVVSYRSLIYRVTFPLNSEIDNVTNYVSTVPIRELGLGLGAEHLSDEQAQELTSDYSLPALKVSKTVWFASSLT